VFFYRLCINIWFGHLSQTVKSPPRKGLRVEKRKSFLKPLVIFALLLGLLPSAQAATDCRAVTEIPVKECQALLALYHNTNGPNWTYNSGWNENNNPCSWHDDVENKHGYKIYRYGVECRNNSVHVLSLPENQLNGTLPDLSPLTELVLLNLQKNELSGTLFNLNRFKKLEFIHLQENLITGNIPDLSGLTSLKLLRLHTNQLTGNIPDLSALTKLVELKLAQNNLTGTMPELNQLTQLDVLNVGHNALTGPIPDLSSLTLLRALNLGANPFSDTLPQTLGSLKRLEYIDLSNSQLTGSIPNLSGLTNLKDLALHNNRLTGPIPALSNLTKLEELYLYNNQLNGPIPMLPNAPLNKISFHNNHLEGSIPDLSALKSPKEGGYLRLDGNYLLCKNKHTHYGDWQDVADQFSECPSDLNLRKTAILIQPNVKGDILSQEKTVNFMANYAYDILQRRGYNHDDIYFLSYTRELEVNAEGHAVDSTRTTVADIRAAFNWAKGKGKLDTPLVVIFVSHGAPNELLLEPSGNQTLTAQTFKSILDDYQNATGNPVVVILEACYTGTLVSTLAGANRVIISSTGENRSFYMDSGEISFLRFYLDKLKYGEYLLPAWQSVKEELSHYKWPPNNEKQVPQLNDMSDTLAPVMCLGGCFGALPGILKLTVSKLPPIIPLGQPLDLRADTEIAFDFVEEPVEESVEVTASLLRPTFTFNDFGYPLQPPSQISFKPVNTRSRKEQWQGQVLGTELTTAGRYTLTVKARDETGFITDEAVSFCVESCESPVTPAIHLINISTRAPVRGGANNAIAGFIITGIGTKKVVIRAEGAGLAPSLPAGSEVLSDAKIVLYQMINGSFQVIATNDNWQEDNRYDEMPAHMQLSDPSDAGLIIDLAPGTYTAIVEPASGSKTGAALVSVNDLDDPNTSTSKLTNISTRAPIEGGVGNVIAGFIIGGTGTQQVVVTAQGKGVDMSQNLLCQDTTMSVYKMVNGNWAEIANNDNWQEDAQAANIPAHFRPADPSDAALLLDLEAGAYTAIMGCIGGTGIGLIGVNAID